MARFVMDTSRPALKQAGLDTYLLKPSLRELLDLTGREIRNGIQRQRCCRIAEARPQFAPTTWPWNGAGILGCLTYFVDANTPAVAIYLDAAKIEDETGGKVLSVTTQINLLLNKSTPFCRV